MNCSFTGKPIASVIIPICNILALGKRTIKTPLRSFLIKMGRISWYIYPKKIKDTDILFIFSTYDMGGAEKVHLDVVRAAREYNCLIIFSRKSRDKHFLKEYKKLTKTIDISPVTEFILGRYLMVGYMQKIIENSKVKIVVASLGGFFYDIASSLQKKDILLIDILHAFDGVIEYYGLPAVRSIDKRVVIDRTTEKSLEILYEQNNIPSKYLERIEYIGNGVNIPSIKPKKGFGKQLNILFVGRDVKVKRVHIVKQVAQKYKKYYNALNTVLVGVEENNNIDKTYQAVGKIEDVMPFYEEADILLIASEREGFPMVVMEAMVHGVIPICTDVGGINMHIQDGVNGFLVKEKDEEKIVDEFVEIISKLDQNRSKLRDISANAYNYAKEEFSIEKFDSKYNELFKSCLQRSKI